MASYTSNSQALLPNTDTLHDLFLRLKKDVKHPENYTPQPESALFSELLQSVDLFPARRRSKRRRIDATTTTISHLLKKKLDDDADAHADDSTDVARDIKNSSETAMMTEPPGPGNDGEDFQYYKDMVEECRRQEQLQQEHHETSLRKIKDLRSVYLYGLQKVSTLQSLREAPDAILPGNFPKGSIQRQQQQPEAGGAGGS